MNKKASMAKKATFSMVNGNLAKNMEWVKNSGLMGHILKANIRTIKNTATEL